MEACGQFMLSHVFSAQTSHDWLRYDRRAQKGRQGPTSEGHPAHVVNNQIDVQELASVPYLDYRSFWSRLNGHDECW